MSFGQTNVGITGTVGGVYINEFHYDNQGTDIGEFVEVAGPAGTDLSEYTITLYNGSTNTLYFTLPLTGTIDDEGTGSGAVSFLFGGGIQNGAPDAIALSKTGTGSTNIQYLSYEGVMTAVAIDGPAAGLNSVNIGVAEAPTATIGDLLGFSLEYNNTTQTWYLSSDDTPGDLTEGALSRNSFDAIAGLRVYPNPANTVLNITSNSFATKNVEIYNVVGAKVLTTQVTNSPVNVAGLTTGIYMVKVTEEGKTATRKLVIE
ncbi:MAG: T9SS type A sorting domain-containing protein [Flavobacterium sp.]|nr:T9SS type A sorting domain-containing protein [Flavobacterium sp.]